MSTLNIFFQFLVIVSKGMHFFVADYGGRTITVPSSAPVRHLYGKIAQKYNISDSFKIKILGETIVPSNTVINHIPVIASMKNHLQDIWGDGFRIPITVHPIITSPQHMTAFGMLSELFTGLKDNMHDCEWCKFILQCADSGSCTIQDLCDRFREHFLCDDDGQLISIKMNQKLTGTIDLNFLPHTVSTMIMARNSFTKITGLDQLTGKQLRYLDVRGSPLEFDLEPLTNQSSRSIGNPLRYIRVNIYQIRWSLLGIHPSNCPKNNHRDQESAMTVHRGALRWFPSSILECMTLGRSRFTKRDNGCIFHESRQQRIGNYISTKRNPWVFHNC